MQNFTTIVAACATISALSLPAAAATTGAPTFTTETGTLSFLNNFQFGSPSDLITLSYTGTIASSIGAPDLVGQTLSYSITYSETSGDAFDGAFTVGGVNIFAFPNTDDSVIILPSIADFTDEADGSFTFDYAGAFAPFGPRNADFPEIELHVDTTILSGSTIKEFFLFCEGASFSDCAQSFDGTADGLGFTNPVLLENYLYTEGQAIGSLTFSTVGGTPIAAVPLPASSLLLLAGLTGLGLARRRS